MSRLYLEAGSTFAKITHKKVGIKEAVYSSRCSEKQRPSMLGLISKAVANRKVLSDILNEVGAFKKEVGMRWDVLTVMTAELLFGSGEIRGGGQLKRFLMERLDQMKGLVQKKGVELGSDATTVVSALPRYVRVNPSRWKSVDAAVAVLKSSGIESVEKDAQIPNLLVLDNKDTKVLVSLDAVKSGDLVMQDKSTCVSAHALLKNRPPTPIHVLDVCSAPGGKAIHILEMLRPGDSLTACERDPKRAKVLQTRLDALANKVKGVKVVVVVEDFLKLFSDDARFASLPVTHINLDPSCSGSGMTETPTTKGDRELRTLASFQAKMLRHALLGFESAGVVCYSTCSILPIENEQVVQAVLGDTRFQVDENPLPEWWPQSDDGFVRTTPEVDRCRGFFLARLVRH